MSYEPAISIEPGVYPCLLRWGLANGYEIETNETHSILYSIKNIDHIRIREMAEAGQCISLNRCAAQGLLASFPVVEPSIYDPPYRPVVRVREDLFRDVFDCLLSEGWSVNERHVGIFHEITKVYKTGGEEVMCRSKVTETVRDCEYDRRMAPFIVRYQYGSTGKQWMNGIDSMEKAVEVLEREKPRHGTGSDWRIYQDFTAALRHVDEIPEEVVTVDDWLWMRIWHPGLYNSDYWSFGYFDNLKDQRVEMIAEEQFDMYSVTGLYACVLYDPPPEKEAEEPRSKWYVVSSVSKPQDTEKELEGGIAVIWAEADTVLWTIFTPDPNDIDTADLRELNKAIRSDSVCPADHAMLYPFYKALKMLPDGSGALAEFERFADNGGQAYEKVGSEGEDE